MASEKKGGKKWEKSGLGEKMARKKRLSIKLPSSWIPEESYPNAEKYVYKMRDSMVEMLEKNPPKLSSKSNLSKQEKEALKYLKEHKNKDIFIKSTDKNVGPAIMEDDWYFTEGYRHLSDQITYSKLNSEEKEKALTKQLQLYPNYAINILKYWTEKRKTLSTQKFTVLQFLCFTFFQKFIKHQYLGDLLLKNTVGSSHLHP